MQNTAFARKYKTLTAGGGCTGIEHLPCSVHIVCRNTAGLQLLIEVVQLVSGLPERISMVPCSCKDLAYFLCGCSLNTPGKAVVTGMCCQLSSVRSCFSQASLRADLLLVGKPVQCDGAGLSACVGCLQCQVVYLVGPLHKHMKAQKPLTCVVKVQQQSTLPVTQAST